MTRERTTCSGCHQPIFFATTTNGRQIPVDWDPADDGNLSIFDVATGPAANVLTLGQAAGMRAAGIAVYRSHFARCPFADEFRRKARHTARIEAARAAKRSTR